MNCSRRGCMKTYRPCPKIAFRQRLRRYVQIPVFEIYEIFPRIEFSHALHSGRNPNFWRYHIISKKRPFKSVLAGCWPRTSRWPGQTCQDTQRVSDGTLTWQHEWHHFHAFRSCRWSIHRFNRSEKWCSVSTRFIWIGKYRSPVQ